MNAVLIIITIITLLILTIFLFSLITIFNKQADAKVEEANTTRISSIMERSLQYQEILKIINSIVVYYVHEDAIMKPYSDGKTEYINQKQTVSIISTVTENILLELSDDILDALSTFIKKDNVAEFINRIVAVNVLEITANMNKATQEHINQTKNKSSTNAMNDLSRIIQSFNE